ncbi:phage integrase SAM-like domain-containing protein [uncultured Winogradskyella sp.]|uniref:tyrosine-type recombinase/integrase n=1 Tax=uncultured Winogradskyella sp. TaxID=395353 RepID=UPI00262AE510|nr:phage integrase SAM-like domain-containing protein [uncultured Winogradskyella sp.]
MKYTFFLKEPNGNKESLILFSCYFSSESKQFKYSTGEKILPKFWSFKNNRPKLKGRKEDRSQNANSINIQLGRYTEAFISTLALQRKLNEPLTSDILKKEFDDTFKKSRKGRNVFYDAYDEFMNEKIKRKEWKPSTIKRYNNIKNHLLAFEKQSSYKLTFSNINEKFYTDYTDYCYTELDHGTNTFARNVGLFKTFMYWAYRKNHTYNDNFRYFKKPERVITQEVALNLSQIKKIFDFNTKSKSLEKVRDVFVFQCLTGLRYGELALVNKRTVINDVLIIKEDKDVTKEAREIPLFEITKYILKKYNYSLPIISNQKQNELIKQVFMNAEFDFDVEYTRNKNKQKEIIVKPFFNRISTHTARRSFITIMKKKGIADKTIMKMTGHRDLKTFTSYYKVDTEAKIDAMKLAFGSMELPKLKKA